MRCDVNVSVRPAGQTELGTKAEVKNMNSFSGMAKAIDYEIERQVGLATVILTNPFADRAEQCARNIATAPSAAVLRCSTDGITSRRAGVRDCSGDARLGRARNCFLLCLTGLFSACR